MVFTSAIASPTNRQHQHNPAHLWQERSKQQPQNGKIIGIRLNSASAHPRHKLGEIAGFWSGLGDNFGRGLGLVRFQFGKLCLTGSTGYRLAKPTIRSPSPGTIIAPDCRERPAFATLRARAKD
jgi:hypothetical protein